MFDEDLFFLVREYLTSFVFLLMPLTTGVFIVPYIMLRVRDWRLGSRDRQLGLKIALHTLTTFAIWGALFGVTTLQVGLIVAGVILAILGFVCLRDTNNQRFPSVNRTYTGIRMLAAGIVFGTAFAMVCTMAWSFIGADGAGTMGAPTRIMPAPMPRGRGAEPEFTRLLISFGMCLLWLAAAVVEYFRLRYLVRQPEQPPLDDHCVRCDYRLRGTIAADGERCPECGFAIPIEQREVIKGRESRRGESTPALAMPEQAKSMTHGVDLAEDSSN